MEQRRDARTGGTDIPEKTRRPAASSGTIATCESLGEARPGFEPGSPRWEGSQVHTCGQCPRGAAATVPQKAFHEGLTYMYQCTRSCGAAAVPQRGRRGAAAGPPRSMSARVHTA
ncbi:hypothetical protein PR048_014610 [Dryococelus australis]|uniref:Uncharacterized protein n=1 Tax=Dryococelus australis TaxID=614101 RepID=A0ABQ9HEP1_9NEOP|nr:hypothetical protein PR048_014610 [Dryococelus australis]